MINNDMLDRLASDDSGTLAKPRAENNFASRREKIIVICDSLKKLCEDYSPANTIESIADYIKDEDRIIYSEITTIVYAMTPKEQGTFNSNLETLMDYALSEKSETPKEMQDTVIRLWDHVHLAMKQDGNVKEILQKNTAKVKQSLYDELHKELYDELHKELYDELHKEFKGMEKEYITILGIFASIIISFVAGITFSTSVFENMHGVGIYRLVLVILLIAFVLLNTINLLVRYIFRLNKAENCEFPMEKVNRILGILLGLLLVCWLLSVDQLPAFINQFLPWMK